MIANQGKVADWNSANINLDILSGRYVGPGYLRVASAGDVNGDGFADLIIGARDANPNGKSYRIEI